MRKILLLLSVTIAILLLSGCVSIPLTDGGTLEISGDGLTIIPSEDDGDEIEVDEKVEASTNDEVESTDDKSKSDKNSSTENNENEEDENTDFAGEEGLGGCAHEFYLLKNRLPNGFPIPECAYITNFELVEDTADNNRLIAVQYENYGELTEEQEMYESFFTNAGYKIITNSIDGDTSTFKAQGKGIELTITNQVMESDYLTTGIMYSETPIIQYKVTDSFINLTNKGHGKCSDEYYTSLSLLTDDFPLPECAKVVSLQIDSFESVKQGAYIYEVDRYWTEEFEAYVEYAEANNFTITNNVGIATQGELEFTDNDIKVSITTTKMGMDKTETYINVIRQIGS